MGDAKHTDPLKATDGQPRRHPWRPYLWAGLLGAVLALLLGLLFRAGFPLSWPWSGAQENLFRPGALSDYIPEDSEAVVAVDVRSLRESPTGRQVMPSLRQFIRQGEQRLRWPTLTGINSVEDLDSLTISFAPGSGGQPLWLARGRFDPARFQLGPDRLQVKTAEHYRVWEYQDRPARRSVWLAPAGDTLIVSATPSRVLAALEQGRHPATVEVRDASLRESLGEVDRTQTLWLAVSFKHLGSASEVESTWLKMILTPLFRYAESVQGGLICAEDVRAELHFRAATEENATRLEADLQNLRDLVPGAVLLLGRQREFVPLLRLLGSAQTSREGKMISLSCRMTAEQLKE